MSRTKFGPSEYDLLCVAHPDDEAIFFGGLLQRRRTRPWVVICMTDGNADGAGAIRKKQFERACRALGVKHPEWWQYPDIYEKRLPVYDIRTRLLSLPKPHTVFTHGIIGEYGHPHHQDVSFAVHSAFEGHPRVFASAYNTFPDLRIALTEKEFANKAHVLTEIYGSETTRFLNLLPATSSEGYVRLSLREVEAVYAYHAQGADLNKRALKHYKWLATFLETRRDQKRPF